MSDVLSSEDIFKRVRKTVAEALYIDEGDIDLEKRLMPDLGAEWVDLLDLAFCLQREFGCNVPHDHLFIKVTHEMVDANGLLTESGIELIYERIPGTNFAHLMLEPGGRMEDLQTVAMLCRYFRSKFPEPDEASARADGDRVLRGEG